MSHRTPILKKSGQAASLAVFFIAIVAIVILLGLAAGGFYISSYNRAVRLDQGANKAWADVDAQLQRRQCRREDRGLQRNVRPALQTAGALGPIPADQGESEFPLAAGPARRHGEPHRRSPYEVQRGPWGIEYIREGVHGLLLRKTGLRPAQTLLRNHRSGPHRTAEGGLYPQAARTAN